jgi:hypothetical protein
MFDRTTRRVTGVMATLRLGAIAGGTGLAYHDPKDVFETRTDPEFEASMQRAWTAARRAAGAPADLDGRWRLAGPWPPSHAASWWRAAPGLRPLPEARDRSASGAAFRGWWHALKGLWPDNDVIVLAAVASDDGEFAPVDHVDEKLDAIVEQRVFDTVLVCQRNGDSAPARDGIRVVRI